MRVPQTELSKEVKEQIVEELTHGKGDRVLRLALRILEECVAVIKNSPQVKDPNEPLGICMRRLNMRDLAEDKDVRIFYVEGRNVLFISHLRSLWNTLAAAVQPVAEVPDICFKCVLGSAFFCVRSCQMNCTRSCACLCQLLSNRKFERRFKLSTKAVCQCSSSACFSGSTAKENKASTARTSLASGRQQYTLMKAAKRC